MAWTELLGNKRSIESAYPVAPSLHNVRLHEVRLHEDGPRVSLRFDLDSFPDSPPRKWVDNGCNRVQLTLMLIELCDLQIRGWGLNNIGDLELEKHDNGIRLEFAGGQTRIVCLARFMEVEKLSAYCDS